MSKIFVASSSKFITAYNATKVDTRAPHYGDLSPIINGIKAAGHEPVLWWDYFDSEVSNTRILDKLEQVTRICDAGVFILSYNDINEDNKQDVKGYAIPNLNVFLELGMFITGNGKDSVLCIKMEDGIDDRFSDLDGFPVHSYSNDQDRWTEIFKKFIPQTKYPDTIDFTYYINKKLFKNKYNSDYDTWKTKSLFIGSSSVKCWSKVEESPAYERNIKLISGFVREEESELSSVDNIVSLGPGMGKTDKKILETFIGWGASISYIPVDINPDMAYQAIENIKQVPIPYAVIDDFELDQEQKDDHIKKIIKEKLHLYDKSTLYMMLGVTFSNFEATEQDTLGRMMNWIGDKDYLMLDVNINYSDESKLVKNIEYMIFDPENNGCYTDLLINAIAKKHLKRSFKENKYSWLVEKDLVDIRNNMRKYIKVKAIDNKTEYTDLEHTKVITVNFKFKEDESTLLVVKSYDFEELASKIETYFLIKNSLNGLSDNGGISKGGVPRGLFLLKQKHSNFR